VFEKVPPRRIRTCAHGQLLGIGFLGCEDGEVAGVGPEARAVLADARGHVGSPPAIAVNDRDPATTAAAASASTAATG
jgi:hypothetical protein